MNSLLLKFIIITSLVFQYGCGLKFKRKSVTKTDKPVEMIQYEKLSKKKEAEKNRDKENPPPPEKFTQADNQLIKAFYSDNANRLIRQDMITHSQVSSKQQEKLVVNAFIPAEIQVIPLPLKLERKLSSLSLHLIRVQVGKQVMIMNVKSRQILDIIGI